MGQARLRLGWLSLLAIVLWLRIPYSALHTDFSRDLFIAWRMLQGEAFPLSGPVLAGTIHLGPIYYWLLALLLQLGRGVFGATILLGLLASAQVPLAYLVGKELHSRSAGILWATALVAPCWSTLEWIFPGHNLLTAPLVLAFLLATARYARRPRRRYLIGMGLIFVLALHAHPTSIALAWIGLAVLARAAWRKELHWGQLALASAVAMLPLLTYLIWDATQDFADLHAGAAYLGDGEKTGQLGNAGSITWATFSGGTAYWSTSIFGWSGNAAMLLNTTTGALGCIGIAAAAGSARDPRRRGLVAIAFAASLAIALTTALIRNVTPYYMTTVLHVALTGLVAMGLALLGRDGAGHIVRIVSASFFAATGLLCTIEIAHFQKHGDFPFAFFPLFDVIQPLQPTDRQFLLPAYASAASGRFLCEQTNPSIHGALAQHLLYNYAIDMRLSCGRGNVVVGGNDAARGHWLGLSRDLFSRIGTRPQQTIGSLGMIPAHPLSAFRALPPQTPVYPPYTPATQGVQEFRLDTELGAGEYLAISNLAFFVAQPQITAKINGREVQALAADSVTHVYACRDCAGGRGMVEISVRSADLADIDIVRF